jgi:hypothetical protein
MEIRKGDYHSSVDKIIRFLERDSINSTALDKAQVKLDKLAEKYQNDESLGSERYKLYQAQAMLSYHSGDNSKAKKFIDEAVKSRGDNYEGADKLLGRLGWSFVPKKSQRIKRTLVVLILLTWVIASSLLISYTSIHRDTIGCGFSFLSNGSGCRDRSVATFTFLNWAYFVVIPLAAAATYAIYRLVLKNRPLKKGIVFLLILISIIFVAGSVDVSFVTEQQNDRYVLNDAESSCFDADLKSFLNTGKHIGCDDNVMAVYNRTIDDLPDSDKISDFLHPILWALYLAFAILVAKKLTSDEK